MSSRIQKVSLAVGLIFIALGVAGYFLASKTMTTEPLFGFFKLNLALIALHVAAGIWCIVAARSELWADKAARSVGAVYMLLTLLALFVPTGFGKVHIGGHNIWLHAILALTLLYFSHGLTASDDPLGMEFE